MMNMSASRIVMLAVFCAVLTVAVSTTCAQEPAASDDLSVQQGQLADRYERLEMVAARLAELSAASDPHRAQRLREAIARSREQEVGVRFEAIVKLLENERLSAAARNQQELQGELSSLLDLLLKDSRDSRIESEQKRIRRYLREVGRLIRWQKGIRARTEGGDDQQSLEHDQGQVAEQTAELGGSIDETENRDAEADQSGGDKRDAESADGGEQQDGEPGSAEGGEPSDSQPSDSQPSEGAPSDQGQGGGPPSDGGQPSDGSQQQQQQQQQQAPTERVVDRLRQATERMQRARERLEQSQRDGAVEEQQKAVAELEQARAELERVLRQLREEEMERTLTLLAARFRKMLDAQLQVNEGTLVLAEVPEEKRGHREQIEAGRLSMMESRIADEADKALLLLREEGSSVAFPETVQQMRDDMRHVVERLADGQVGPLTQSIEQDIVESLEEAIAALEKAIRDLDENRSPPGQAPPGEPMEPPLVDKLAELKLIRSLQLRINRRTARYGEMIEGEQAEIDQIIEALNELAERQLRLYQATSDLSSGRND